MFQTEVSPGWIPVKFNKDVCGAQRRKCNDFREVLSFLKDDSPGSFSHATITFSKRWMLYYLVQTFKTPSGLNGMTLMIL